MEKDINKFLYANNTIKIIKNQYKSKEKSIFSEVITKKINNDNNLENLSKIAVLMDSKFLSRSKFSEVQKELMIETVYSQYEFLNKNINLELDDYLKEIHNNLNEINNKEWAFPGTNVYKAEGLYTNDKIYLSKKRLLENDNKYLVTKFCHELNHCYLGNKQLKSYTEDMFTESAVYEIIKENFPEFIIKDKDFTIKFSDGDTLKTKVVQKSYSEVSLLAETLNKITKNEFLQKYFTKSFSNLEIKELNEIHSRYNDFYESKKTNKGLYNKNYFLELENSLEKLITKEVLKRDLDIKIIKPIIEENPRELQKDIINLNEKMFQRISDKITLREKAKKDKEKFIENTQIKEVHKTEDDFKYNNENYEIKDNIENNNKIHLE